MTARLPNRRCGAPKRPAPVRLLRARSMIRYAHSPARYGAMEGALARGLLGALGSIHVEAIWGSILHVARQQTGPLLRHRIHK